MSYTVPDTPGVWHAEDYTNLSLETPLLAKGIALYPANSEETSTKLEMLGIPKKKLYVLPNLCPDVFLNYSKLRKIAVVSNHVPQELKDLKLLAADDGIRIDYYGVKGRCRPITPEILPHYDVVITIGKTVQYALGMGIPVFNYDYFGGAGYLTSANWAHEAFYNFSGRGTPIRCSGEELLEILKAGFENARFEALKLRKTAGEKYRLSKNVDALLRKVQKLPDAEVVYEAGYGEKCRMVLANRLHKKKFWRRGA